MSDSPSKPRLNFPNTYIPYLEKHKIFDLFHEIARELAIRKPDDHVLFTKQILLNAVNNVNTSRVILLASPKVNALAIAEGIAKSTQQTVLNEEYIINLLGNKAKENGVDRKTLLKTLAFLLRTKHSYSTGWILVDIVRDEDDAKFLISQGVLPTHVLHLIATNYNLGLLDLTYCNVPENWPKYRRNITALRKIYAKTIHEVPVNNDDLNQIVETCVKIINTKALLKPIVPRVVILGPRGSGRKSQAKLLKKYMGVVHIDFEYLLCQAWNVGDDLAHELRLCKREVCFHSELLNQVVNRRVLQDDCLKNGWVLTGYPFTETDFKYLDSMDTPPNRVIFLECDITICTNRITSRQINAFTASKTNITTPDSSASKEKVLKPHPKDNLALLNSELAFYCTHYGKLRQYCEDTAAVINGDQDLRWVHECIVAFIVRRTNMDKPRKGLTDEACEGSCTCIGKPPIIYDGFVTNI